LRIRRLREEDSGSYQCQAVNVVGQSDRRDIDVDVTVDPGELKLSRIQSVSHVNISNYRGYSVTAAS